MATRSNIGIRNLDGSVEVIYCHYDGYLEDVGKTLLTSYSDLKYLRELLKRGAIRNLDKEIEMCGPLNDPSMKFVSLEQLYHECNGSDIEYIYTFDEQYLIWTCMDVRHGRTLLLDLKMFETH